ncbi:MAG: hypothetical protein P4L31_01270 [Candidatus Babeliales bacterium]|nr:hypothetical protein [Candidatus Babeliales bacterium]
MKHNKRIALYSLFIITAQSTNYMSAGPWDNFKSFFNSIKPDGAGVKAAQVFVKDGAPVINEASAQFASQAAANLTKGIVQAAPNFASAAGVSIADGIKQAAPNFASAAGVSIADGIKQAAPNFASAAGVSIADGIKQAAPGFASKGLGEAGVSIADGISDGLAKAGDGIGDGIKDGFVEGSKKFGIESVEKLAPAVNVAVGIYAATQVWSVGKDIHSHFRPNAAQRADDMEAHRRLAFFQAAQSYHTCMKNNKTTPRTSLGFPANCHSLEEAFVEVGGRKEVDERKETFKEYNK